MSKHSNYQSYIVEYALKILIIIFLSSVFFFQETIDPINNFESKLSFFLVLRLVVLVALSVVLLALSGNTFKTIAFSTVIVGSFYKLIILISQDGFYLHQLLTLSDSLIIIGISVYYLYRHTLKVKSAEYKRKRRSKLKKLQEVEKTL
jgi:prepilin signal peptidase PulO-like enzyme (type II secretory pathway)